MSIALLICKSEDLQLANQENIQEVQYSESRH